MKKISFWGLFDEKNLGDPVLGRCTKWLYQQSLHEIAGFDLSATSSEFSLDHVEIQWSQKKSLLDRIVLKIVHVFKWEHLFEWYLAFKSSLYYTDAVKQSDLLVVVGGGLIKYKAQYFWLYLSLLIKLAEKYNKTVILNAVGVEGYDINDYRCKKLKRALKSNCVKHISVRDDVDTMNIKYLDNSESKKSIKVSDSAVWTSECYDIITNNQKSNTIGLGIARGYLFVDHGIPLSPKDLKTLYVNIAESLINKGYKLELFCNGSKGDCSMIKQVENALVEKGIEFNTFIPGNDSQLITRISTYKAIIATRLHSCIIAYSLNVPAIGLVWNDKLSLFGEQIGHPENFIDVNDFDAPKIVASMEKSIDKGYNSEIRKQFRALSKINVDNIVNKYFV